MIYDTAFFAEWFFLIMVIGLSIFIAMRAMSGEHDNTLVMMCGLWFVCLLMWTSLYYTTHDFTGPKTANYRIEYVPGQKPVKVY